MSNVNTLSMTRRAFVAASIVAPLATQSRAAPANLNRFMVQGRPQDTGSLYKVRNIMPALDLLGGVRRMRCRAPFSNTPGWVTYQGLAREGVRFCFTLPVKDPTVLVADLITFERDYPGAIAAIEFPNEPDLNPVTYAGMTDKRLGARKGDAPALMAFCRDVTELLSSTEELKDIPRIAFNDWMQPEQRSLVRYFNSHIYPKPTSSKDAWLISWKRRLQEAGYTEGVITEWGRTTGGGEKNFVAPPVSLDQQAELLQSDLVSIFSEPSVSFVSLYELLAWPGDGEQQNFGLFNADLTPRPVVSAIRSLLS